MADYKKVNVSHHLSSYRIKVPHWNGTDVIRTPFSEWQNRNPLPWYEAYHAAKHDRHAAFKEATFSHLIDACCGLIAILSAQFYTRDFSTGPDYFCSEGHGDGMESAIGGYFRVGFPHDWNVEEQYGFDWQQLKEVPDPFQMFDYASIG